MMKNKALATVACAGLLLTGGLTTSVAPASAGAGSCSYGSMTQDNPTKTVTVKNISCTGGMKGWAWARNTNNFTYKGPQVTAGSSKVTYSGTFVIGGFSWG